MKSARAVEEYVVPPKRMTPAFSSIRVSQRSLGSMSATESIR